MKTKKIQSEVRASSRLPLLLPRERTAGLGLVLGSGNPTPSRAGGFGSDTEFVFSHSRESEGIVARRDWNWKGLFAFYSLGCFKFLVQGEEKEQT